MLYRLLPAFLFLAPVLSAAEPFELKDGDRVVWLGSTFVEREQKYGYWEYALTAANPNKNITFRNLGWSGETVFGDARAGFDDANKGFQRMVELALALKPTVILMAFGTNESFAGKGGIERFTKGYDKLLDALAPSKARFVLFTPTPFDEVHPVTDAWKLNENLALYRDAIISIAGKRKLEVLDLFQKLKYRKIDEGDEQGCHLTYNGMHFSQFGYRQSAHLVFQIDRSWNATLGQGVSKDASIKKLEGKWAFDLTIDRLPLPLPNDESVLFDGAPRLVVLRQYNWKYGSMKIEDLPPGNYNLLVDGESSCSATDDQWKRGVNISASRNVIAQAENLRRAIIAKNELYFYRWRPQNETYLFGFRKHEQGKNASEVVEFDPLIDAKEKEIARLRVPVAQRFKLVPIK